MANIRISPTWGYGNNKRWITGFCVQVEGSDACGEFHSGTMAENKRNAEIFARTLVEQVGAGEDYRRVICE